MKPFLALVPLVALTRRADIMGPLVNRSLTTAAAACAAGWRPEVGRRGIPPGRQHDHLDFSWIVHGRARGLSWFSRA